MISPESARLNRQPEDRDLITYPEHQFPFATSIMKEHLIPLGIRYKDLISTLTLLQESARGLHTPPAISSDRQGSDGLERWTKEIDELCEGFRLWGRDIKSSTILHDDSSSEVLRVLEASELRSATDKTRLVDKVSGGGASSDLDRLYQGNVHEASPENRLHHDRDFESRSSSPEAKDHLSESPIRSVGSSAKSTARSSKAPQTPESQMKLGGGGTMDETGENGQSPQTEIIEDAMDSHQRARGADTQATKDNNLRTSSQILHNVFDQVHIYLAELRQWIDSYQTKNSDMYVILSCIGEI